MAYWGNIDRQNNAPLFTTTTANGALGNVEYGVDIYGVNATEATVADKGIAPGWVKVKRGMGPLVSVTIDEPGTGYANGETFVVEADSGANVEGEVTTDGDGVITAVEITEAGGLFVSTSPTVTLTTSAGTGATLVATVSGRAGRVQYETLVALAAVSSDGSDDTVFPDS